MCEVLTDHNFGYPINFIIVNNTDQDTLLIFHLQVTSDLYKDILSIYILHC